MSCKKYYVKAKCNSISLNICKADSGKALAYKLFLAADIQV